MHSRDFVHRDIKPENFVVGTGKKTNMIYVIDFGLSKRFKCPQTGQHIKKRKKHGITGTPRFISDSVNNSNEHGRCDDLESIGNIAIYLAKGGYLPWCKAEEKDTLESQQKASKKIREETSLEELC
jgi:casein kinase 1